MENDDSKNYGCFKEIWESPDRYALVKDEFREEFSIIDIVDKLYILIEDEHLEKSFKKNSKRMGVKSLITSAAH